MRGTRTTYVCTPQIQQIELKNTPDQTQISNQTPPLSIRSTAMFTFPCEATSARTQAAVSVKPMSFIWLSCAAYVSSGFATGTAVGGAGVAADGDGDGVGAFEAGAEEEEEGDDEDADAGGTAQGLLAPAPPKPPSNAEKSRPPAAGGGAGGGGHTRETTRRSRRAATPAPETRIGAVGVIHLDAHGRKKGEAPRGIGRGTGGGTKSC